MKISELLGGLILISIAIFGIMYFAPKIQDEIIEYKAYHEFCDNHTNFCYCDYWECEYKTSWSSLYGLSNDTKELCKLAEELKDEKMIFQAGCRR